MGNKKREYKVTSKTTRIFEGYSDLCWMDIGVHKLEAAAKEKAKYSFVVTLGREKFEYDCPAETLLSVFLEKGVRKKHSRKEGEFSFFLEYTTGCLYHSLSHMGEEDNLICRLNNVATISAEEYLDRALAALLESKTLPLLIARTALWADCEKDHLPVIEANNQSKKYKGSPAKYPYVKRKASNENRGWSDDTKTLYLDDNSYPNSQMKKALFNRLQRIPQGYETCHIWEKSCYDSRYHTCFANLVLLPRALASLSDHHELIRSILKYRAYTLFNFVPEGKEIPVKPPFYPEDDEWLTL